MLQNLIAVVLMRDVINMYKYILSAKKEELLLNNANASILITTDKTLLKRVIINLTKRFGSK